MFATDHMFQKGSSVPVDQEVKGLGALILARDSASGPPIHSTTFPRGEFLGDPLIKNSPARLPCWLSGKKFPANAGHTSSRFNHWWGRFRIPQAVKPVCHND